MEYECFKGWVSAYVEKYCQLCAEFSKFTGRTGQELVVEKVDRCTQTYKWDVKDEESAEMSTQTDSISVKDSCQYLVCEVVPKVKLGIVPSEKKLIL